MREGALKTSVLLRLMIIGVLTIVLLIPTLFVSLLISDRQASRTFAVKEVTQKWGNAQTIVGPILTIPVTHQVAGKEGQIHTHTSLVRILPNTLDVTAQLTPEIRQRGIYRLVLYTTRLSIQADYSSIAGTVQSLARGQIHWEDATVTLGISDLKGIGEVHSMTWDNRAVSPEGGHRNAAFIPSGLTVRPLLVEQNNQHRFTVALDLRGSDEFRVVPSAKETRMALQSSWKDPSFVGDFLPEDRNLGGESFSASWRVQDFNRNLPQSWVGDGPALMNSSFGVKLLLSVEEYQKISRALKYSIMFIALTFLAFFVLDMMTRSPFHPVHYAMIGFGLVLFYVLLLSLSEYLSFDLSYWSASLAIVLLITLYAKGVTSRLSTMAIIGTSLLVLYGFLFVLLQLADYALLLGSFGLLIILGLVMYLTRRIDWYAIGRPSETT